MTMPWLAALMATIAPLPGSMLGIAAPPRGPDIPTSRRGRGGGSGAWRRGGRLHVAALRAWHKHAGVA
jgi:hypothetical protein